ncbi:hypothetical protein PG994_008661 [Apiospora phragmitis]|uniref:Alpha N-terminal protein methyltransferase 1 n=1 Tax=Apiospora phragmitis TaxID=2905665 RepID=A0ABR1UH39_9PEZI
MAETTADVEKSAGRLYSESTDADVNGMLGGVPSVAGFANVSKIDLQGSRGFLAKLGIGSTNGRRTLNAVLEGGAGIGRVTEGLLVNITDHVDVIEPVTKFTAALQEKRKVRTVFSMGLEEWQPTESVHYDLVWTQWCVGYLMNPVGGVIVIKENLNSADGDYIDPVDGKCDKVRQADSKFQELIKQAGLRIIRMDTQRGLPRVQSKKLFPVKMYAMKPE